MPMAKNEIAVRFTEEQYFTRREVAEALRTNLIDHIWSEILDYRKQFKTNIELTDLYNGMLYVTSCSSFVENYNNLNAELQRYSRQLSSFEKGSITEYSIIRGILKEELKSVAKSLQISINDIALDKILDNECDNEIYRPVENYYRALEYVRDTDIDRIDDELLATLYQILEGDNELIEFYRTSEIDVAQQKIIINRTLNGVPANYIERMMDQLFGFINHSGLNYLIKTMVVKYMIDYIKPFSKYNELIGTLLMNAIVKMDNYLDNIYLIPFEKVLVADQKLVNEYANECQRSKDITYYVLFMNRCMSEAIKYQNDEIVRYQVKATKETFYRPDEEYFNEIEEPKKETLVSSYEKEVLAQGDEEPKQVKEAELIKEVKTEPVKETIKPVQEEKPVVKTRVEVEKVAYVVKKDPTIDERTLKKMENALLESDPLINKKQAHFYVRHCALGHFYTIQQFKKAEGCVYETARTSMDNLAKRGYYRRENIKNKFVYTPIDKE